MRLSLNIQSVSASFSDLDEMGFCLDFSMTSSLPQKWGGYLTLLAPSIRKVWRPWPPWPPGFYAYVPHFIKYGQRLKGMLWY